MIGASTPDVAPLFPLQVAMRILAGSGPSALGCRRCAGAGRVSHCLIEDQAFSRLPNACRFALRVRALREGLILSDLLLAQIEGS